MLRWDIGLLTQRYIALYEQARYEEMLTRPAAASSVDHWVRCCDDLDEQLAAMMSRVGLACGNISVSSRGNCSLPEVNTAEHELPWRRYYDDATLCLVQVRHSHPHPHTYHPSDSCLYAHQSVKRFLLSEGTARSQHKERYVLRRFGYAAELDARRCSELGLNNTDGGFQPDESLRTVRANQLQTRLRKLPKRMRAIRQPPRGTGRSGGGEGRPKGDAGKAKAPHSRLRRGVGARLPPVHRRASPR
jgi:hypothetical protein